jgi:rRNA-processing protein FCF1
MKSVILDTSFLLTCVRQKIDFASWLELEGIQGVIPLQVEKELVGLSEKGSAKDHAKIALEIINKKKYKTLDLNSKNVDQGIINYANKHKPVIVATIDRGIQKQIKNKKLIIRGKKMLEIK